MNDVATVAQHPTVAKKSAANYTAGRRAFFKYRDLGVTAATGGKLRAQITSASSACRSPPAGTSTNARPSLSTC